jgi:hypothetical protein
MGGRLMSTQLLGIVGALLMGVLANDVWALSAPLARRLVVFAAGLWARDREQAQILGEEWRAYIDDRPGQVLKLCTAAAFLAAAVARMVGHKLQARPRRVKPALGVSSWLAGVDFSAAQANAVAIGLLVGLASSFASLIGYAAGLDPRWAVIGWGVGLSVAVVAIITSITLGFFVARQDALPRDAGALDTFARILAAQPEQAEHLAVTDPRVLVRPFVVRGTEPGRWADPAESGLVRPYVRRDSARPDGC